MELNDLYVPQKPGHSGDAFSLVLELNWLPAWGKGKSGVVLSGTGHPPTPVWKPCLIALEIFLAA